MTAESSVVSPISSLGEEETPKVETPKLETPKLETPKLEEKEEVAKPEEQETRDLSVVYEDDNDGSKNKQFCGDFCACAIL